MSPDGDTDAGAGDETCLTRHARLPVVRSRLVPVLLDSRQMSFAEHMQ